MNEPLLYVVILNWNGEGVIRECLDSLERVEYDPLQIVVVDNNSTDDSAGMVRDNYPGVKLIENDRNLLFAGGNNVGIRYAMEEGADYILLLNNDTEVDAGFAGNLMDAIRNNNRIGIAGPKILYHHEPSRIWYGGGGFYPLLWIPRHIDIRKDENEAGNEGGDTGYVSGCCMLIRKEVIDDIGLLDASYHIYCEDVDYCLRGWRAGWRCIYEPSARVYHKVSSSSGGGMTPYKLENRLVSTARLFRRFRPVLWRLTVLPLHALGFIVLCLILTVTGRWNLVGACIRGAVRIWRGDHRQSGG